MIDDMVRERLTAAQRRVLVDGANAPSIAPKWRQDKMFERLEQRGLLSRIDTKPGFVGYALTSAGRLALSNSTGEAE